MSWFFQEHFYIKIFEIFGESLQHEMRHKNFTNHPLSNRITEDNLDLLSEIN